jgi:hypothetical protein
VLRRLEVAEPFNEHGERLLDSGRDDNLPRDPLISVIVRPGGPSRGGDREIMGSWTASTLPVLMSSTATVCGSRGVSSSVVLAADRPRCRAAVDQYAAGGSRRRHRGRRNRQ